MVKKNYSRTGRACRVTFELPTDVNATTAFICGEFNDWSRTKDQLTRRKDGRFSITLSLEPGKSYRFRYLLDGERWENDWQAEQYLPNEFNGTDSVVTV